MFYPISLNYNLISFYHIYSLYLNQYSSEVSSRPLKLKITKCFVSELGCVERSSQTFR